ncbi:MAG: hypothetical protein U0802_23370 [Candidatus Binatia bacterium]
MTLALTVSDVSGQKRVKASAIPKRATVSELVQGLLARMRLPRNDASGRPLTYRARLEREGRHLHPQEEIGEVLRDEDELTLQPNIDAGGGA